MKKKTYLKIFDGIQKYTYGERLVNIINRLVTGIIYIMFISMIIYLIILKDIRLLRVISVTGISFVLVSMFRYAYNSERPYTKYGFEPIVKKDKVGESMPSRHVFSAFVIGMAFLYIKSCLAMLIFPLGVLMCVGRVVAGVHFPKDVIAGAVIGIFSGIVGFWFI